MPSPLEIEQALRNDYAQDADKARRQRLAISHMATEAQLERLWPQWTSEQVWSPQTVEDIHQDLFARLPDQDRIQHQGTDIQVLMPGVMRTAQVSVGWHACPPQTNPAQETCMAVAT